MGKTGIQWTDRTWNPVTGCTKVSAGCARCYAKTLHDQRHAANLRAHSGYTINGRPALPSDLRGMPDKTFPFPACYDTPFETVMTHEDRLREPLSWRKPQRVFVGSMTDLFHEDVPDSFLDQVFAVMALTPHITYQLLTKRPERMAEYLTTGRPWERWSNRAYDLAGRFSAWAGKIRDLRGQPLPNAWLGTTVEDQDAADRRILELLRCPAAVHFLSCEPLLEAVDIRRFLECCDQCCMPTPQAEHRQVIIGGESGPKARPTNIAWIRDLREQCQSAEVPVFVKQVSKHPIDNGQVLTMKHSHGGDMDEWPWDDLKVREFPNV